MRSSSAAGGRAPGLGVDEHAVPGGHERGDGHDLRLGGELRVGFGVDLGEHDVVMGGGGGLKHRCEHSARAAPRRPPVNQHDPVAGHGLFESRFAEFDEGHGFLLGLRRSTEATSIPPWVFQHWALEMVVIGFGSLPRSVSQSFLSEKCRKDLRWASVDLDGEGLLIWQTAGRDTIVRGKAQLLDLCRGEWSGANTAERSCRLLEHGA